ncbi:hypothetical protein JL193_04120 [Polaribacter batillariae]|uniref:Glycosyl hydrolase family 16 n=1 Tax=Polaribacter batillariae TaxID=2808900 RepID=A0ABX7SW54_9FLAO|nr:hypothetical protein [Polaribacter batillariae]QTD38484.1 hypothetical protein JL193_04120 [Polaribacter batillariae]
MKTLKNIKIKYVPLLGLILMFTLSCERNLSDEAVFANNSNNPNIFIDGFSAGLDYNPFGDSKLDAFSVDTETTFRGSASMRIDVPAFGVGYAGANFPVSFPRDLTGYDALTFYAKASQAAKINEIGFGIDPDTNSKFRVALNDLPLTTNWVKYVIPIPDPSKLTAEKGMLWYAEGARNASDEGGYVFWLDEVKFEKLGTIGQSRPKLFNGEDQESRISLNNNYTISELTHTLNWAGNDITLNISPSYFSFQSSDNNVAIVNESGVVTLLSDGEAKVTASIAGVAAKGSLTISKTDVLPAPDPTKNASDVISIYSDTYTSLAGFNPGFFAGSNTGNISTQSINGNEYIDYENIDFVGTAWDGTVNVSGMDMLHLDVQLRSATGSNVLVELVDFGPDKTDNGLATDGTAGGHNITSQLIENQWVSIDIPLNGFTLSTGGGGLGSPNLNNLGYIVFVSNNNASFLVDNVYFYTN